jgi:hypothetical protein
VRTLCYPRISCTSRCEFDGDHRATPSERVQARVWYLRGASQYTCYRILSRFLSRGLLRSKQRVSVDRLRLLLGKRSSPRKTAQNQRRFTPLNWFQKGSRTISALTSPGKAIFGLVNDWVEVCFYDIFSREILRSYPSRASCPMLCVESALFRSFGALTTLPYEDIGWIETVQPFRMHQESPSHSQSLRP